MLASRAVAYMNVDIAVQGLGFYASATPQLDELLIKATKQVRNESQGLGPQGFTTLPYALTMIAYG